MADQALKQRIVLWLVNRAAKLANQRLDKKTINKYGITKGRVGCLRVTDLRREFYFRVHEGRLEFMEPQQDVDGGMETTSDTLIALARGKRRMMNPATGELFEVPYAPVGALMTGEVRLWGKAVMNDALLLSKELYDEVFPEISSELAAGLNGKAEAA